MVQHRIRIEDRQPVEIAVSPEKVSFLVAKAREFDAKVEPVEPDPGSNESDDQQRGVLEDYADDLTAEELRDAIRSLNDDEIVDLIAIVWVGRGDFDRDGFADARALAVERHRIDSSDYLLGMPMLGDFLEEGMATLGYSPDPDVLDHL
jgi:hypothetical protein